MLMVFELLTKSAFPTDCFQSNKQTCIQYPNFIAASCREKYPSNCKSEKMNKDFVPDAIAHFLPI